MKLFEFVFLDKIRNISSKNVTYDYLVSDSLNEEMHRNAKSAISLMLWTFIIVCVFTFLSFLVSDWVRCKLIASLLGILVVCMAIGSAFGFLLYCGAPFPGINISIAFLMLGMYKTLKHFLKMLLKIYHNAKFQYNYK